MPTSRSSRPVVFCEKVFLRISQNSQENTCARASFLIKLQSACNFIKKETLVQVFSCEFCNTCGGCFWTGVKTTFFQRLQYLPTHALFLHGFVSRNDPSQSCSSDDFTHSRARKATPSPHEIEQALQGDHSAHDAARE